MSKNVGVFVDVANLYYAAKSAGVDVDYVTLLKGALRGRDLIRAYAYSGLDPENENQRKFIDFLSKNGYKVVVKDIRKYGDGKIKANLDIELVVDLFRLADRMDAAVIISGDGDFAPAIRALQDKGVRAEVISFRGNTSSDLIAVADEFIDIMKVVQVGRTKKDAVVPPEMPAKEVTPEFSFREAPPSVAAAARAALRTGGRTSSRSAARRGEPPAVLAIAVGSEAEQAAERGDVPFQEEELVATAGDPREAGTRRRRRRGGRGRGRSRGDSPAREPGADDFDALSELDLGEEREYAFSEADEETLAELGLLSQEAPVSTAAPAVASDGDGPEAGADDAARPRRGRRGGRGRTRAGQEADADAAPEAVAAGEAPVASSGEPSDATPAVPRRRAPRRTAAASPDSPESGTSERKPRASGGRRPRAAASASEPASAPEVSAEQEEAAAATAPRPRRRRTAATSTTDGSPSSSDERPPQARRARQASRATESAESGGSVSGADETTGGAGPEPPAPAATRSDESGGQADESGGQPRGIWQRLLSGRKD